MSEFVNRMANSFADELEKIAHMKSADAKAILNAPNLLVPGVVAGALGTLAVERAHRDWRTGRQMRLQGQVY